MGTIGYVLVTFQGLAFIAALWVGIVEMLYDPLDERECFLITRLCRAVFSHA